MPNVPNVPNVPRTVSGGILRPDATQLYPGNRGTLSRDPEASVLAPEDRFIASSVRPPRRIHARRLANQAHRRPVPESGAFGDDRRIRVNNPLAYPFSAICALRIYFPNAQPLGGTGFLIGPRLLLTAGHNVYSDGHPIEKVEVFAGLNGFYNDPSVTLVNTERWLTVDTWSQFHQNGSDYGALVLPTDLGAKRGWLSVEKRADGDLPKRLAINTSGYPLDCPAAAESECPLQGTTMWWDVGTVSHIDDDRIYYNDLCMYEGDSGSPIIVYEPGAQDEYRVIGIHTYLWSMEYFATRINSSAYKIIGEWLSGS